MTVKFSLGETKNVGFDGMHMIKGVKNIGTIVEWAEAINVLEVETDYLGLPCVRGVVIGGGWWSDRFTALGGVEKILEASANVEVWFQGLGVECGRVTGSRKRG